MLPHQIPLFKSIFLTAQSIKKNWFPACLIPVFLLAYVLYKNIINIPTGDDIYVMEMFNQLKEVTSWWEKSSILFSQHNEHRIALTRLFALLQYSISGYIDLRWWIIAGNLCLVFVVLLFYKNVEKTPWLLIPTAFILFCPASNTYFAMQNANLFSIVFSLASLHFALLERSKSFPRFTFLFSLLSIFSNGGGFVVLILIGGVFFFQKRYQLLGIWAIWTIFLFVGYFWHYEKTYRHNSLNLLFEQLPNAFRFLLAFLGSIAFFPTLAQLTGALFLGLSLYAFYKRYYLQNPFIFLCLVYGLSMSGLTSLTRYYSDITNALSERYAIYSMLLAACSIIFIYDLLKSNLRSRKYVFGAMSLLSILLNLKYFTLQLRYPEDRKEDLMSKMENYHLNNSGFNCFEVNTLTKLAKNGLYYYRLGKSLHSKAYYDSLNRPLLAHLTLHIDTAYQTKDKLHITGTITNPSIDIEKIGKTYRLWAIHNNAAPFDCTHNELTEPKNDKTLFLNMEDENKHHKVSLPTFAITVPKKHFLKGEYAIYLLFMNDNTVNHSPVKSNIVFHL